MLGLRLAYKTKIKMDEKVLEVDIVEVDPHCEILHGKKSQIVKLTGEMAFDHKNVMPMRVLGMKAFIQSQVLLLQAEQLVIMNVSKHFEFVSQDSGSQ